MKRLKAALLTALIFAATGPFVGGLAYAFWGFSLAEEPPSIGIAIMSALWMIPFAYVIGLAPAAGTGLIAGLLAPRSGPPVLAAIGAIVGALVMAAISALTAAPLQVTEGVANLAVLGAVAGGLSGLVSGILLRSGSARPDGARRPAE